MSDVVARAREALATTRAQKAGWWPRQLVVDLLDALDEAREELEHLRGLQRDDREQSHHLDCPQEKP